MTVTMVAGTRPKPPTHPVVLKADRMVDVDRHGSSSSPGRGGVEGDHIVDVGPERMPDDAEVIELGDVTLAARADGHGAQLPHGRRGLHAHERGAGRSGDEDAARDPGVSQDAARRLHDRAQPRHLRADRRPAARRLAHAGDRRGLVPGPADLPVGPRHHADRRAPRPHDVRGHRAGRDAADGRGGHRRRRERGAPRGALPDQVRRQADQGVRVGWCDVAHRSAGRAALLRRGARARSSTRPTGAACTSPRTRTATTGSAPRSRRASTASSTRR